MAEGYPNDPEKAHAEIDKAYAAVDEDETQHSERDADYESA